MKNRIRLLQLIIAAIRLISRIKSLLIKHRIDKKHATKIASEYMKFLILILTSINKNKICKSTTREICSATIKSMAESTKSYLKTGEDYVRN